MQMLMAVYMCNRQARSENFFNLRGQFGINFGKVYLPRIYGANKVHIIIGKKAVLIDESRYFPR